MLLHAFLVGVVISLAPASATLAAAGTAPTVIVAAAPAPTVPPVTENPFLPDESKNLDDCISSLPRPDCGSQARGGWHQSLVLVALVLGLSIIGWRIIAGVRRAAPTTASATPATPATPAMPSGGPPPPATLDGRAENALTPPTGGARPRVRRRS